MTNILPKLTGLKCIELKIGKVLDTFKKLRDEGSQLSEKIGQLKMQSSDGKFYNTDAADTDFVFLG